MTLEWYVDYFNNVLYPLNYPYKLQYGVGVRPDNKNLYLCIQIHTQKGMVDAFKIWGKNDKEILKAFKALEFHNTLKCLVSDEYNLYIEENEG